MGFRFSGHETFPCRYAWLPKAFGAVNDDPHAFADEEAAMIRLGVGKNMVRSIRFWMLESNFVTRRAEGGYAPTDFGRAILKSGGFDPFLEDIRTLWLIHWQFSTPKRDDPLFAWDLLINRWQAPELSRSAVVAVFRKEADKEDRPPSNVTLEQHFDTFLHTYVPTSSKKGEIKEDNLDCPLIELELIHQVGERQLAGSGRRESIYAFRREEKPEITPALFAYCLDHFWRTSFPSEKSLTFREIAFGQNSPGQVFKLPEWNIRQRLDAIGSDTDNFFKYSDTATQQMVTRSDGDTGHFLRAIY